MLNSEVIRKIEEFVYERPRSVQEISEKLKKNWRTADRYVEEIIAERGSLGRRVFREGTRGALKIVYWASVEKASATVFQEDLEKRIVLGRRKRDFSAFDIYQHITKSKKSVWVGQGQNEVDAKRLFEFRDLLVKAKKQILFFSGNLSFINFKDDEVDIFEVLSELVKRGISIKVLCRVGIDGEENIRKLLSLNFKHGKEMIEVRHREHPLRVSLIDGKLISLKEVLDPMEREGELDRRTFIFYTIKDRAWGEWLGKIFWRLFMKSVGSEKRLSELERLAVGC